MTSKWTIIAKVVMVQPEKINLLGICWPSETVMIATLQSDSCYDFQIILCLPSSDSTSST